jgi:hypothetical protein
MRAKRSMIQQPKANFSYFGSSGEHTKIDGKKHLRKSPLEIIELDLKLSRFAETQAVRGICQSIQPHPMIPMSNRGRL